MVMLNEQLASFPASSLKVYWMVETPIEKNLADEDGPATSLTLPELSVAVGSDHETLSYELLVCTISLEGQPSITGGSMSSAEVD